MSLLDRIQFSLVFFHIHQFSSIKFSLVTFAGFVIFQSQYQFVAFRPYQFLFLDLSSDILLFLNFRVYLFLFLNLMCFFLLFFSCLELGISIVHCHLLFHSFSHFILVLFSLHFSLSLHFRFCCAWPFTAFTLKCCFQFLSNLHALHLCFCCQSLFAF